MAEVYSGWITGWLLGLTRQWDESPSSRTRGAPYPAVCGARQPPGSRERKADDLLPFFAASCSADLERPCWFSQSRRESKGDRRERRLTGRQPENTARMMWPPLLTSSRRTLPRGLWASAENGQRLRGSQEAADGAVPTCADTDGGFPLCGGDGPALPDAQTSLLNTLPQTLRFHSMVAGPRYFVAFLVWFCVFTFLQTPGDVFSLLSCWLI